MEKWIKTIRKNLIPKRSGGNILLDDQQVALFHYNEDHWFATQNQCPHCEQMVISRGIVGDFKEEPKVVCPLRKEAFSLKTGKEFEKNGFSLKVYPVMIKDDFVFIKA
ncbi:MAG: nitrite reductase small subunit NirD [Deltaproteobacteria bacterium]|nr:nitrite reductase small subunit NirD [Deltaproteobacteria bacterium]